MTIRFALSIYHLSTLLYFTNQNYLVYTYVIYIYIYLYLYIYIYIFITFILFILHIFFLLISVTLSSDDVLRCGRSMIPRTVEELVGIGKYCSY